MDSLVRYELDGTIATLTMDDGKRNALGLEMFAALGAALDRARSDHATVVLTGREGVFSAGFDLRTLTAGGRDAYAMLLEGFDIAQRILSFPTPVVIACTGHALAMGAFLALSGDYRVGASGPFKVGANEVAIGLVMPYFGVEMCRHRLTPPYFQRSVINAEIYTPEDAVHAGFLDRLVAPSEVVTSAHEIATQLAKLDVSVHHATKMRAREQLLSALRPAVAADSESFAKLFNVSTDS